MPKTKLEYSLMFWLSFYFPIYSEQGNYTI